VSTPLSWDEVEEALDSRAPDRLTFETSDVLDRVQALGDLYAPNLELVQSLPAVPGSS
jgi:bifunctional non-homologous end joining protein LigD